jgi:hypothetical protein
MRSKGGLKNVTKRRKNRGFIWPYQNKAVSLRCETIKTIKVMTYKEAISKNRPVNPKKAAFYDSLIEFYVNTISETEKQKRIEESIQSFFYDGKRLPLYDIRNVKVLNKEIVEKYKPTHRRKIRLYAAIVAYMEAKFGKYIETEYESDFKSGFDFDKYIIAFFPSFVGVPIISPKTLKEYKEKKKETEKSTKHYSINVHLDVVVPVEVDAVDEATAIQIAKDIADMQNYDDVFVRDACITDVR